LLVTADVTDEKWASRGAHKLVGALDAFSDIVVEGRRCLDAGASTGGFTDVLLRRGAREVVAVDVGYGQLVWRLQTDERVQLHDRTNVRTLTGKRPVCADHISSTFYFPWHTIRFLEIPPDRNPPPPPAPGEPSTAIVVRPEDEPDDEIDEEFLRRVRDV
jgi:hypothetical protein